VRLVVAHVTTLSLGQTQRITAFVGRGHSPSACCQRLSRGQSFAQELKRQEVILREEDVREAAVAVGGELPPPRIPVGSTAFIFGELHIVAWLDTSKSHVQPEADT